MEKFFESVGFSPRSTTQTVHSTLQRSHVDRRLERLQQGTGIDWATAEALAIGSLLMQGCILLLGFVIKLLKTAVNKLLKTAVNELLKTAIIKLLKTAVNSSFQQKFSKIW